ncbi:growth regulator [Neisseria lisongii]|uniref:Growth regulator n=1 Tax=Neisseria lisongii TaxID=2912188 RepID=A0AAW5ALQ9_9NEIS|nr:growth regulator [Neisseria lisongii]MCF7529037.1 growth regulator [Neisseria lisongii]
MLLTIRKMGNSQGVILPKALLGQIGASDCLEVSLEQDSIVLRRPTVRQGWAEAAALAAADENETVWPQIENEGDAEWTW